MRNPKGFTLAAIAAAGLAATALVPISAYAADGLLSGSITSAAGEKLGGVTVSAKAEGSTITTSVYTDESGNYYFPPLPSGKYQVWAQALGFETAKGSADLTATVHHDITLAPITDEEARIKQLPSELLVAALPEDTADDARIKKVFTNQCTGCHTPGYPLQFKFDEAGWNKIINLMKVIPGTGVYPGPNAHPNGIINYNQKELAAYLARARGPGATSMHFKPRPRPSGEEARVVWTTYEVPLNPDAGIGTQVKYNPNDGSDWSLGTTSKLGELPHDGGMGLDGNLYFTSNNPNHLLTIGKIDAKTGALTPLKVDGRNGNAATAHGLVRDGDGNFWFDVNPGRRSLGKLDVKTDQITVYQTPTNMTPLGGAVTMDVDGKGKIWASAPNGVLRFDPVTETFTEFKSNTPFKFAKGTNSTYGAAGDRDGNGWWAEMIIDTVNQGVSATGQAVALKLPPVQLPEDAMSDSDRKFYASFSAPDFNAPVPWNEGPRRMGTDKNGDVLWVGNSWGGSLAKIDIHTHSTSFVPLPGPGVMQPYHITVDSHHDAWLNIWTSDVIMRYDPAADKWTTFDLPTRGTEARYISLLEKDGTMEVVVPYSRTSKVAVMAFRSEADIAALKQQAGP